MCYVNPSEVMRLFKAYLEEYGDMLSKDSAINELEDALASAECQWVETEDEQMGAYDCDCMENLLSERKNRLNNGNCSEKPNSSGLRKCPFCGGEARLIRNARRKIYGKDEYRVGVVACCNVCEARMFYGSEKLAVEAWNRRAE